MTTQSQNCCNRKKYYEINEVLVCFIRYFLCFPLPTIHVKTVFYFNAHITCNFKESKSMLLNLKAIEDLISIRDRKN